MPCLLLSLWVLPVLAPQATRPAAPNPAPPPPASRAAAPADPDEYRIGPEDVLALLVWQNADLSRTVQVRPDGRISLPLVNEVLVSGLTPAQLRQTLMERYREFDKAIELSVMVQEVNNYKVTLLGKVGKPGRYRLRTPTSVLELLGEGGGLAEYADGDNIVVLRQEASATRPGSRAYKRLRFNYKRATTQAGGEMENIPLLPNDIVVVP
jgi:polysaccharide export outer membrane protein